jgi:hypothetical protein
LKQANKVTQLPQNPKPQLKQALNPKLNNQYYGTQNTAQSFVNSAAYSSKLHTGQQTNSVFSYKNSHRAIEKSQSGQS